MISSRDLELLRSVAARRLPAALPALADDATFDQMGRDLRDALVDALTGELIECGLGPDDEPNDLGTWLENLIDAINASLVGR